MYTPLIENTTSDADVVMENFYHVAQGDRLPRGGSSFDATGSVYDLGSEEFKWACLYCNNIHADIMHPGLQCLLDVIPTAWSVASYEIITNGDECSEFIIDFRVEESKQYVHNTIIKCYINNDSASNYHYIKYGGVQYPVPGDEIYSYGEKTITSATYTAFNLGDSVWGTITGSYPVFPTRSRTIIHSDNVFGISAITEYTNMGRYYTATVSNVDPSVAFNIHQSWNGTATITSIKIDSSDWYTWQLKVYRRTY